VIERPDREDQAIIWTNDPAKPGQRVTVSEEVESVKVEPEAVSAPCATTLDAG